VLDHLGVALDGRWAVAEQAIVVEQRNGPLQTLCLGRRLDVRGLCTARRTPHASSCSSAPSIEKTALPRQCDMQNRARRTLSMGYMFTASSTAAALSINIRRPSVRRMSVKLFLGLMLSKSNTRAASLVVMSL